MIDDLQHDEDPALRRMLREADCPRLSPLAMARIHAALDDAPDRIIFRTARFVAAIAAAIIIACSAALWVTQPARAQDVPLDAIVFAVNGSDLTLPDEQQTNDDLVAQWIMQEFVSDE